MSISLTKNLDQRTSLNLENKLWNAGIIHICGIDEVGRGSIAGPVTACAAIFNQGFFHPEVTDSKLLSSNKRRELKKILCKEAVDWRIGFASVEEIDFFNIRQATFLAMRRAIGTLTIRPDYALIDGEGIDNGACISEGIIKGDKISFTMAAASIIAKVIRDDYMKKIGETYPAYKFERNKGYGTKEHIKAIITEGICEHHRRTFLSKINISNSP
jgi:ribonuclease HII